MMRYGLVEFDWGIVSAILWVSSIIALGWWILSLRKDLRNTELKLERIQSLETYTRALCSAATRFWKAENASRIARNQVHDCEKPLTGVTALIKKQREKRLEELRATYREREVHVRAAKRNFWDIYEDARQEGFFVIPECSYCDYLTKPELIIEYLSTAELTAGGFAPWLRKRGAPSIATCKEHLRKWVHCR